MTIKEMRDVIIHFTDHEYDDYEICLWDYNNQRRVEWNAGGYSFSKPDKCLTFPVLIEPIDGEEIDRRLERMIKEVQNNNNNNNNEQ